MQLHLWGVTTQVKTTAIEFYQKWTYKVSHVNFMKRRDHKWESPTDNRDLNTKDNCKKQTSASGKKNSKQVEWLAVTQKWEKACGCVVVVERLEIYRCHWVFWKLTHICVCILYHTVRLCTNMADNEHITMLKMCLV